ncbi:O-antigen ligase family protein [Sphingomonas sp.]|uniref:O-antigen ligase family protein n=1 Tax=Sphingomonas sp. TaxID=28214 RepID=UPI003CC5B845
MSKNRAASRLQQRRARLLAQAPFFVLAAFLVLTFLTGGGARADILSLLLLRPVSALVCGYAVYRLQRADIVKHRVLLALAAATVLLVGAYLVPLPPAWWHGLAGHQLIVQTDAALGFADRWRPLSLAPTGTENALFSLLTPLAVLLLTITLPPTQSARATLVIIGLGLISGALGILQILGPPAGPFYLYAITNNGSSVGLFANRNHAAVFLACLFPFLASVGTMDTSPDTRSRRLVAAAAMAIVLVPLIVITGSRAGVACAALGLIFAAMLYRHPSFSPRRHKPHFASRVSPAILAGIAALVAIGVVAALMRRGVLDRFQNTADGSDSRLDSWREVMRIASDHLPFGSGYGTFDDVFRIYEPTSQLAPTYLNHAHNDWLELWMTGGVGAAAVLGTSLILGLSAVARVIRTRARRSDPTIGLARLGAAILSLMAVASAVDYPVRTPSLAALCALCAAWLSMGATAVRDGAGASFPERANLDRS